MPPTTSMAQERILDGSREEKLEFVRRYWPSLPDYGFQEAHYVRLLQYADRQIEKLQRQRTAYSISSRDEVGQLIERLRQPTSLTKASAIQDSTPAAFSPTSVSRSLDLAASIWLTVRVESTQVDTTNVNDNSIVWADHTTLQDCVTTHFSIIQHDLPEGELDRIPRSLTAANLCHRYRFRVAWTDNLAKHLTVDWDHKEIIIYEHVIFLFNHIKYPSHCHIPIAILEEAIDTINLLFPSGERETRTFLEGAKRTFFRLGYCERERCLRPSAFRFWRKNILQLIKVLDEPPTGWRQLGLDREQRNFLDWATFWLALVVAILTITSIAFGIASIVYAVESYEIAVKSYDVGVAQLELAVAQACAAPGAKTDLPQFCTASRKRRDKVDL
ncbi:hypothetical protein F4677DRAFT_407677 [Hypoxylon crocopeplum]|nr:hypothetical protein F4677DRAFT_407677 [Hypoxylon crocopeplum]